ncbi:LCP family protein [Nocardioides sp.]|uniref:LCP family protein n=1 Tax=Nocardioides sp. TaxID=35761 RepID=UPI0039E5D6AD
MRSTEQERAARVRFRRSMALLVMTLVLPGSAQLLAGTTETARRIGRIALLVWLALVALVVGTLVLIAFDHGYAFHLATTPWLLQLLRLGLVALAIGWGALLVDAWRLGQPLTLLVGHRRFAVGVNAVMCAVVAGVLLFGSHIVGVQRGLVLSMFSGSEVTGADHGRFNVLLLGGDSDEGKTRWGLRPDSLTIASIDAETGKTVLVGLPRNMTRFPFVKGSVLAEQFPDGYDCDGCYLNSLATWAADNESLFKGYDNPGVEATIEGVEGITGLEISYWAMVDLTGFQKLVDAVGGVTLNVREPIPVGIPGDKFYSHLKTGTYKLNGWETLWYARARHDSDDYSRMARQKCVMSAMLDQVSPQTMLTKFGDIAAASSAMVSTNIPSSEVDRFISLALKAKSQKIATVSLVPPAINTGHPNIKKVKSMVTAAIDKAEGIKAQAKEKSSEQPAEEGTPATTPTTSATEAPAQAEVVTGGSVGSLKSGYAANESDDLASAC